jgi:hypothetical protein
MTPYERVSPQAGEGNWAAAQRVKLASGTRVRITERGPFRGCRGVIVRDDYHAAGHRVGYRVKLDSLPASHTNCQDVPHWPFGWSELELEP